jgi:hypothetical protein
MITETKCDGNHGGPVCEDSECWKADLCIPGVNGYREHDWSWVKDWMGDPGVINGTADCSHYVCRRCGDEKAGEPPTDGYEFAGMHEEWNDRAPWM